MIRRTIIYVLVNYISPLPYISTLTTKNVEVILNELMSVSLINYINIFLHSCTNYHLSDLTNSAKSDITFLFFALLRNVKLA